MLSYSAFCRGKFASMPTAARPHSILHAKDLRMLAIFLTDFAAGLKMFFFA